MSSQSQLPEPFRDLEPYLEWSLATERGRTAKRHASSMAEIKAFYAAMLERLDEILKFLNDYS
ncbi:MAG: hypothetical protein ACREQD_01690, partial [Candidatus Binataceae bacterium]